MAKTKQGIKYAIFGGTLLLLFSVVVPAMAAFGFGDGGRDFSNQFEGAFGGQGQMGGMGSKQFGGSPFGDSGYSGQGQMGGVGSKQFGGSPFGDFGSSGPGQMGQGSKMDFGQMSPSPMNFGPMGPPSFGGQGQMGPGPMGPGPMMGSGSRGPDPFKMLKRGLSAMSVSGKLEEFTAQCEGAEIVCASTDDIAQVISDKQDALEALSDELREAYEEEDADAVKAIKAKMKAAKKELSAAQKQALAWLKSELVRASAAYKAKQDAEREEMKSEEQERRKEEDDFRKQDDERRKQDDQRRQQYQQPQNNWQQPQPSQSQNPGINGGATTAPVQSTAPAPTGDTTAPTPAR